MKLIHGNVKCGCGHRASDHFLKGFCQATIPADNPEFPAMKCECLKYHPNRKWSNRASQ